MILKATALLKCQILIGLNEGDDKLYHVAQQKHFFSNSTFHADQYNLLIFKENELNITNFKDNAVVLRFGSTGSNKISRFLGTFNFLIFLSPEVYLY